MPAPFCLLTLCCPVVVTTGNPQVLAAQGKAANVPVIFGTNRNEGTLFTPCPTDLTDDKYLQWMDQR